MVPVIYMGAHAMINQITGAQAYKIHHNHSTVYLLR